MSDINERLLQGNEACAHAAMLVGARFFAGYPITPSTEVLEVLAREFPRIGGKFIQMEDEIASMGAIIGASLTGVKSLTATSGPGFSLKQENLGYACIAEVPCVIVNVMRGGPSTGQPTQTSQADIMQARWGTHGDHPIIAITPSSVQETIHLTIEAFNLSEKYRTPVIFMLDEILGHMREKVVFPNREDITVIDRAMPELPQTDFKPYRNDMPVPPLGYFGCGLRFNVTGLTHDERGFPTNRQDEAKALLDRLKAKLEPLREAKEYVELIDCEDADIILIAYGITARVAKSAMLIAKSKGIKVGMIRPVMIWPFPDKIIAPIVNNVKAVIVSELNMGQLICEVERYIKKDIPVLSANVYDGTLMEPSMIAGVIENANNMINEKCQSAKSADKHETKKSKSAK